MNSENVEVSINNKIRNLLHEMKEAILSANDKKFAQLSIEVLHCAPHAGGRELFEGLHSVICDASFDLGINGSFESRKRVAPLLYKNGISLCRNFLN